MDTIDQTLQQLRQEREVMTKVMAYNQIIEGLYIENQQLRAENERLKQQIALQGSKED